MIEINNLTTNQINEGFLKKIVNIVLSGEKKEKANISVALVGEGRIRELNKKYRKKNRTTDVLAFPESKILIKNIKTKLVSMEKLVGLGEVVICLREVKKNSKRNNLLFENELARVLIHGVLHLLGYDHEKDKKEAEKMHNKEEYYLKLLNAEGLYNHKFFYSQESNSF